jgi:hypothetical protein
MEEEMARFAAPRQAPASIGSAGAPELDGLFVELIEE